MIHPMKLIYLPEYDPNYLDDDKYYAEVNPDDRVRYLNKALTIKILGQLSLTDNICCITMITNYF